MLGGIVQNDEFAFARPHNHEILPQHLKVSNEVTTTNSGLSILALLIAAGILVFLISAVRKSEITYKLWNPLAPELIRNRGSNPVAFWISLSLLALAAVALLFYASAAMR